MPDDILQMVYKQQIDGQTLESMLSAAKEKKGQEHDLSSVKFLELLIQLRIVLIQDSVILRQEYPGLLLWNHEVRYFVFFTCEDNKKK